MVGLMLLFDRVLGVLNETSCSFLPCLRLVFSILGVGFPFIWGLFILNAFDKAQKVGIPLLATTMSNTPKRVIRFAWPQIVKIEEITHDDD
jgi:hypothetical protein